MNQAIRQMLDRYEQQDRKSRELALREILQEIALVGLWRGGFYEHAAFYGGTAVRIIHGLDRFSEDLDFTLLSPNKSFSWEPYYKPLEEELAAYGFSVTVEHRNKVIASPIKSAFLKANTYQELLRIGIGEDTLLGLHPNATIKIKVEIDTEPSVSYNTEQRYLEAPTAIPISVVTIEDLFAAKMHAAFFRAWKNRVKGRDWYDVIWFMRKKTALRLDLFSVHMGKGNPLSEKEFRALARECINNLDVDKAVADLQPFLYDTAPLSVWSKEFIAHWFSEKLVIA